LLALFLLVYEAALELLRQEKSIRSAESKSEHCRSEGEAERGFLRQSITQRSKFDAETGTCYVDYQWISVAGPSFSSITLSYSCIRSLEYKFGSDRSPSVQGLLGQQQQDSKATEAVVTILVAIAGDSTQLPEIKSRASVLDALKRLAVDSQVDDCLLSGEISWAPELRSESLSLEDIYADYPALYPV
jgi:uncharacterized membrane protein